MHNILSQGRLMMLLLTAYWLYEYVKKEEHECTHSYTFLLQAMSSSARMCQHIPPSQPGRTNKP